MQKYLEIPTKWLQIQEQSGVIFYIDIILWIMFIQTFMVTFLQIYFYVYGSISIKQNVRQSLVLKPIWGIQTHFSRKLMHQLIYGTNISKIIYILWMVNIRKGHQRMH